MEVYTHFTKKWAKSYTGLMDPNWLDAVLPASCMSVDPLSEMVYVEYAHLVDEDYFAKFLEVYGVDLLHVWSKYYHWDHSCYGQPLTGQLREFGMKYERMVRDSIMENDNRAAALAISKMNHTPVTQEIDECLEMVGMENKVRGILA